MLLIVMLREEKTSVKKRVDLDDTSINLITKAYLRVLKKKDMKKTN